MYTTTAWAKKDQHSDFEKVDIKRNNCSEKDVTFKLKYCGVCHSDVHIAWNELGNSPVSWALITGLDCQG